ncbi:MAG: FKBP-type peptidyl-prolyl cis-trans isomerase [Terracidiphilus sp.]|jgi:peptidylprolyl isomerase
MKNMLLILLMAASAAAASSQNPAHPATHAAIAAQTAATAASAKCPAASAGIELPPGVPPAEGDLKDIFALRYQDIKVGAGAEAEQGKLFKVQYTYWLAADGHKIDSTYDHPGPPLKDKDGKIVMGNDGKPMLGDPMTVNFIQGRHQMIWGFDQGLQGMKVGGKRRLFIPWQLAWGAMGHLPAIPPKADMIYDVDLVGVTDAPAPPPPPLNRPPRGVQGVRPLPLTPETAAPTSTGAPASTAAPAPAPNTSAPAATAQPAAPATPAQPEPK